MIFDKRALLALGIACAACPFSHASKGGKNPPHSSKAHKESTPFFVASAACAQKCISAEIPLGGHLLTNAIQQCDAASYPQQWVIVQDGAFIKVKSVEAGRRIDSTEGFCLGVVPQVADVDPMNPDGIIPVVMMRNIIPVVMNKAGVWIGGLGISSMGVMGTFGDDGWGDDDMCSNGNKLGLVSCDHPTAQWSSTDGQLISSYCWGIGHSSVLSVNEGCTDLHLSTTSDGATAISRSETFMAVTQEFVETIPPPHVPTYYPTDFPTSDVPTVITEEPGNGGSGYGADNIVPFLKKR